MDAENKDSLIDGRAEVWEGDASLYFFEEDLDTHPDMHVLCIAVYDVTYHPDPFVQIDHYDRPRDPSSQGRVNRLVGHRVAVHRAQPRHFLPSQLLAPAAGAHGPGRMAQDVAAGTVLDYKLSTVAGLPKRLVIN